jgi:hypothetical protein
MPRSRGCQSEWSDGQPKRFVGAVRRDDRLHHAVRRNKPQALSKQRRPTTCLTM